eukprot:scaffold31866_cov101-Isochrysis_galbana.AAC.2
MITGTRATDDLYIYIVLSRALRRRLPVACRLGCASALATAQCASHPSHQPQEKASSRGNGTTAEMQSGGCRSVSAPPTPSRICTASAASADGAWSRLHC